MTTTPNFRALGAKIVELWDADCDIDVEINELRELLATPPPEPPDLSQLSDGYHTFEELYEHRHALTLSLIKARPDLFWFSRRHNDGELCFGDGMWFIVGAELPGVGAITYHLPMRLWDTAALTGAAELEIGKPWDGHTAADVVDRLMAWAVAPPPKPPTDEDIHNFIQTRWHYRMANESPFGCSDYDGSRATQAGIDDVRAALERWGQR